MTNKREGLLLVLFLSLLLGVGGIVVGKNISGRLAAARQLLADKQQELEEARHWLDEKNYWLSRQEWVLLHPAPSYEGQQSESAFVQNIQASLAKSGIQTLDQRLQESEQTPRFLKVTIDLSLQSSLEQLVHWLYEVQPPRAYRVISRISLKSDEKGLKIQTELSLVQLFDRSRP